MKILVTGGAGFIGSHLIDDLLNKNHEIIVYDNLEPQVHGLNAGIPEYLSKKVQFIQNDIRQKEELKKALIDVDVVYHLAAMVGVGQSMYQIDKYVDVNTLGTARLLDLIVNSPNNIKKVIVASSMSTYGEGSYICEDHGEVEPPLRSNDQMKKNEWELKCPYCQKIVQPIPTKEKKDQNCTSIYALSKKEQEKMTLMIGKTYGINTTALRFFNVYGSRQSLNNPYTGVCAIFSSSIMCGNKPIIYEDGLQTRDFVHISDISQALQLSMERPEAKNQVFNVGADNKVSILEVAQTLSKLINPSISVEITKKFRPGDVRHCYADISKISNKLGYKPKKPFEKGMEEFISWVKNQDGKVKDNSKKVQEELKQKGLI